MARKWIAIGGAGAAGPAGPSGSPTSTAPAISFATCSVSYLLSGFSTLVQFSGTINLPVSDPHYANLAKIVVIGTDPNGNSFPIATVSSPFSGSTVNFNNANGAQIIQPSSDQTWTISFWTYDANNLQNISPYTTTVTVKAAGLTSMALAEIGPRINTNGSVSSTFQLVITVTNSQFPIWVTTAVDYDDGNGPQFIVGTSASSEGQGIGQFYLTSGTGGTTITWTHWVPTNSSQTSWVAYAVFGAIGQNVSIPSGWPSWYITQTLTVAAVGAPLATGVTNAQFVPNSQNQTVVTGVNAVGSPDWYYPEIDWTQPTTITDPNYWFSMITVQKGYAQTGTGTVSGLNTLTDSGGPFLQYASSYLTTVTAGGAGYVVGDMLWLVGGTSSTVGAFTVKTVSGGAVTAVTPAYPGTYTATPSNPISTTTSGAGSGCTLHVPALGFGNQVGNDIHIGGVLTTITGFTSSTIITFAPVAGIVNGASQAYEIWNPSPDYEGANNANGPGIVPYYLGRQIADSGGLSPTDNSVPGSTVQLFGSAADAWNLPAVHNADGTTYLYNTFRFRIYAGSYLMFNLLGGTLVLQTACWTQSAVTDHQDVTPTSVSNPLDLSQTNLTSTNGQFAFNGSGKLAIAQGAISAQYTNLAAINAASGALAANAVVSGLRVGTGSPYTLNAGINVFTGAVYLSQGHSSPVVAILNTGIFLYGVAQSSGDPTGLTSQPYVAIQSTGILAAQSSTGAAVFVNSSTGVIWLYSVNASTSSPYMALSSSGVTIASSFGGVNNYAVVINSSSLTMTYNSVAYITLNTSGITLAAGATINTPSISGGTITGTALSLTTTGGGGTATVSIDGTTFAGQATTNVRVIGSLFSGLMGSFGFICSNASGTAGALAQLWVPNSANTPGQLFLSDTASHSFQLTAGVTFATATAGAATPPSNPVEFLLTIVNGNSRKIALYAN